MGDESGRYVQRSKSDEIAVISHEISQGLIPSNYTALTRPARAVVTLRLLPLVPRRSPSFILSSKTPTVPVRPSLLLGLCLFSPRPSRTRPIWRFRLPLLTRTGAIWSRLRPLRPRPWRPWTAVARRVVILLSRRLTRGPRRTPWCSHTLVRLGTSLWLFRKFPCSPRVPSSGSKK